MVLKISIEINSTPNKIKNRSQQTWFISNPTKTHGTKNGTKFRMNPTKTKTEAKKLVAEHHQHLGHLRGLLAPHLGRLQTCEAALGDEETSQGHEGGQANHLQVFLVTNHKNQPKKTLEKSNQETNKKAGRKSWKTADCWCCAEKRDFGSKKAAKKRRSSSCWLLLLFFFNNIMNCSKMCRQNAPKHHQNCSKTRWHRWVLWRNHRLQGPRKSSWSSHGSWVHDKFWPLECFIKTWKIWNNCKPQQKP